MGGGHVTRRDEERFHNETSGIGPGPSGHRDGVRTRHGTSHNNSPEYSLPVISGINQDLAQLNSFPCPGPHVHCGGCGDWV